MNSLCGETSPIADPLQLTNHYKYRPDSCLSKF